MTVEVEPEGEKDHHELAKPLADLLGMKHESRANILQALFTYIRLHKLQVWAGSSPAAKLMLRTLEEAKMDRASLHHACLSTEAHQ